MEFINSSSVLSAQKKIIYTAGTEATMEYMNPNDTFVPKIQLLFSPFGLPFVPIEILGTDVNKIISNFSFYKDRDNPSSVLSFNLAPDPELIKSIVDMINKYSGNSYSQIWGSLGVDLEDLFKPMTLSQLWVNGYHLMTGMVRSCVRNSSVENRSKTVSYSIVIDEISNLYNRNTLSLDTIEADQMQMNMVDSFTRSLGDLATTQGVPLSQALSQIIRAFVNTSLIGPYKFSCSDGMPVAFRLMATQNPTGAIANLSFAMNMSANVNLFMMHSQGGGLQSAWSFLKNLIPNPWLEFFTESGGRTIVTEPFGSPSIIFPGFNYIVARSVPYSNPLIGMVNPVHMVSTMMYDLSALALIAGGDFIIITDDMVIEKSLGFDSTNQFTIFHTRYESKAVGGGAMDVTDKPICAKGPMNPMASGGIKTFGFQEMFQSIDPTNLLVMGPASGEMSRIGKTKMGIPTQIMSKPALSNLLCTWFRNQSRFREGSVVCRGIPYARPGMYCLYLPSISGKKPENLRDIGMYYINSIQHSYALENDTVDFRTTLNLIRGVPMPMGVAQTALLLFDFEILPPDSGMFDGEVRGSASASGGLG